MNQAACLPLILLATLLAAPPARAADPVPLEHRAQPGQRAEVEESRRTELEIHVRKDGQASVGGEEVATLEQRYTEEVVTQKPLVTSRSYERSLATKGKPGADLQPQQTSVHGRSLRVQGLELKPAETFTLSKQDKDVLRLDRLARAFLPPERQAAPREKWKLPSDPFARALFGDKLPTDAHHGGASVEFKKLTKKDGRQVAHLRVRLELKTDLRQDFPGLHFKIRGTIQWDLDEHDLLAAELNGVVAYELENPQGVLIEAKGPFRYAYQARYLIPRPSGKAASASEEPPPKGAKLLVCSSDPTHKIPLDHVKNCPTCGEKLDAERKCPKDHPWVLRHCVQCGGPFKPE